MMSCIVSRSFLGLFFPQGQYISMYIGRFSILRCQCPSELDLFPTFLAVCDDIDMLRYPENAMLNVDQSVLSVL